MNTETTVFGTETVTVQTSDGWTSIIAHDRNLDNQVEFTLFGVTPQQLINAALEAEEL
jgi:hypothetical protein